MKVAVTALQPHPKNRAIYGEEDVSALKQSIEESGWIRPLTVTSDYLIVSGHRRYQAAVQLGYTELPIEIEAFPSEEAIMERLLRENENRGKTPEQQIREGMTWEPIEEKRGKIRVKAANATPIYKALQSFAGQYDKNNARDAIARRVGLGSGVTYEKGKEVVTYMDITLFDKDREAIRMALNEQSISAAHRLVQNYKAIEERLQREIEAKEQARIREQEEARQRYLEAVQKAEHCTLYHCSVADLSQYVAPGSIDCILTDPPYPREFLPVYSDLAAFASYALRPGGSLVVMVGQSYLQEVMERLSSTDLTYRWTFAYLTPGVATQVHQGHAQSMWKPLLWLTKGEYTGMYVYDVFKSQEGDKLKHDWGQSESGIAAIMERMTKAGELVCDPFVGGGTTAMVAMEMERRFVGCDVDETCVKLLEARKASLVQEYEYV